MHIYRGKKPCPACGISGEQSLRRRIDGICGSCSALIALGQGVKAETKDFSQIKLSRSTGSLYVTDLHEKGSQSPRRFPTFDYVSDTYDSVGASRSLLETLRRLIELLDEGKKAEYQFRIQMKDSLPEVYSVKSAVALQLVELFKEIGLYGDRREQKGFADGRKLLNGLCNGTISIDDFNRQSIRKTYER